MTVTASSLISGAEEPKTIYSDFKSKTGLYLIIAGIASSILGTSMLGAFMPLLGITLADYHIDDLTNVAPELRKKKIKDKWFDLDWGLIGPSIFTLITLGVPFKIPYISILAKE